MVGSLIALRSLWGSKCVLTKSHSLNLQIWNCVMVYASGLALKVFVGNSAGHWEQALSLLLLFISRWTYTSEEDWAFSQKDDALLLELCILMVLSAFCGQISSGGWAFSVLVPLNQANPEPTQLGPRCKELCCPGWLVDLWQSSPLPQPCPSCVSTFPFCCMPVFTWLLAICLCLPLLVLRTEWHFECYFCSSFIDPDLTCLIIV